LTYQQPAAQSRRSSEGKAFLPGAIDLYEHANPDILPRLGDDIDLARRAAEAGLAAVVHRHHYSPTAERAALARQVTGFRMLGAVLLNDSLGGLNPTAVELALEMEAVWVGLPTLSALAQRQRLFRMPVERTRALTFGPGRLTLTGEDGRILPVVGEILELAAQHDVPVNLGYAGFPECLAAVRAAPRSARLVITNPLSTMGFTSDQLDELLRASSLVVEQTCYSLHPTGSYGGGEEGLERAAAMIRAVGPERTVLSSDGGMAGSPEPAQLLAWGCSKLLGLGISPAHIQDMTHSTPAWLIGCGA
jgi:hypothetical protein